MTSSVCLDFWLGVVGSSLLGGRDISQKVEQSAPFHPLIGPAPVPPPHRNRHHGQKAMANPTAGSAAHALPCPLSLRCTCTCTLRETQVWC